MLLVNTNNIVACVGNEISELSDGTFSYGDIIYYDKTLQLIAEDISGAEIGDTYENGTLTKKVVETPIEVSPAEPQLSESELLKAQNKALSDRLEFAEDLIAEMAMMVYA